MSERASLNRKQSRLIANWVEANWSRIVTNQWSQRYVAELVSAALEEELTGLKLTDRHIGNVCKTDLEITWPHRAPRVHGGGDRALYLARYLTWVAYSLKGLAEEIGVTLPESPEPLEALMAMANADPWIQLTHPHSGNLEPDED